MDQDLVVNVLIKHKKQTGKEIAAFCKATFYHSQRKIQPNYS